MDKPNHSGEAPIYGKGYPLPYRPLARQPVHEHAEPEEPIVQPVTTEPPVNLRCGTYKTKE